MLLDAVIMLESAGFVVRAMVSDGASQNRKFYRMCREEDDKSKDVYCVLSTVDYSRHVFFFSDVPHLIKTAERLAYMSRS